MVKGFSQVHGTDFTDTFAPTATFAALRTLNVVAARYGLKAQGFDVVAAYLNSPLDHEIWVKSPPPRFQDEQGDEAVESALRHQAGRQVLVEVHRQETLKAGLPAKPVQ